MRESENNTKINVNIRKIVKSPGFWFLIAVLLTSFWVGKNVSPTWSVEKVTIDVKQGENGKLFFIYRGKPSYVENIGTYKEAVLSPQIHWKEINQERKISRKLPEEYVLDKNTGLYYHLTAKKHWKFWSLIPAFVAIVLCWMTREPLTLPFRRNSIRGTHTRGVQHYRINTC